MTTDSFTSSFSLQAGLTGWWWWREGGKRIPCSLFPFQGSFMHCSPLLPSPLSFLNSSVLSFCYLILVGAAMALSRQSVQRSAEKRRLWRLWFWTLAGQPSQPCSAFWMGLVLLFVWKVNIKGGVKKTHTHTHIFGQPSPWAGCLA